MRIVMFYHSALSDWNHGNAHFLRGIATELAARGHDVMICEPVDAWSVQNLLQERGAAVFDRFREIYPLLDPLRYDPDSFDVAAVLEGADVVLVHEWNEPDLVARIGRVRADGGNFSLFFHDTHHRAITAPDEMARFDLSAYDGVLAFGEVLRALYVERGWAARAWTWHEAADVRVFRPPVAGTPDAAAGRGTAPRRDLVWIGNWGDDERGEELREFVVEPVRALGISATAYGVRYPGPARRLFAGVGIEYRGWLPNFEAPTAFAQHRVTVHVPRRPYARALPGIPTIRPFEALACGIPLVSAPWDDAEGLFRAGTDYLVAEDGAAMRRHLRDVLSDAALARSLAQHGLQTILERHTCAHRVDELIEIHASLTGRTKELIAS